MDTQKIFDKIDLIEIPEDLKDVIKQIFLASENGAKQVIVLTEKGGDKSNKGFAEKIKAGGIFPEPTVIVCSGNYLVFLPKKTTPFPADDIANLCFYAWKPHTTLILAG